MFSFKSKDNPNQAAVNHYLSRYERKQIPGFLASDPMYIAEPLSEDSQPPYWELRISILPTQADLTLAARALAPILIEAKVEFKILKGDPIEKMPEAWDATQCGGDRDQRGKEVCIFMPLTQNTDKDGNYIPYHDGAKMKKIMLDCWKALIDNSVIIGYYATPLDKPIRLTTGGPTPFSYAAFKPYKQRRGILHEDHYNPRQWTDPLNNLIITQEDLESHGINPIQADKKIKQVRATYFDEHYQDALDKINQHLAEIEASPEEGTSVDAAFTELEDAFASNKETDDKISILRQIQDKINTTMPLLINGRVELSMDQGWLDFVERSKDNRFMLIEQQRKKTIEGIDAEIMAIQQEYTDSRELIEALKLSNMPSHTKCMELVDLHPRAMQALYPRLIHLSRELNSDHLYIDPDPHPSSTFRRYIAPVALVLTGLAMVLNFIVCLDEVVPFDANMIDHVGGKWTLASTSVVGAACFAWNIATNKDEHSVLKNKYLCSTMALLCLLQAAAFAVESEHAYRGMMIGAIISCMSAIMLMGSAMPLPRACSRSLPPRKLGLA